MNPLNDYVTYETRRQFFGKSARGLGLAALGSLGGLPGAVSAASAETGAAIASRTIVAPARANIRLIMALPSAVGF